MTNKEKECKHKDVDEIDFCDICGGSHGVCNDCDADMIMESIGSDWEEC